MELLYVFGLIVILAKSDATVTFTVPTTGGTPACPDLGTVAEGTTSGTVVTSAATADNGAITYALAVGGDSAMFSIDSASGVVTIANNAVLDFETKTPLTVIVTGADSDAAVSATCTLAVTDVSPWFNAYSKTLVLPESQANGALGNILCSDGGDTAAYAYLLTGGDDTPAKFAIGASDGAFTKTGADFNAATKSSYTLTFTCVDGANTATATVEVCINNESNCPSKASINHGVLAGLVVPTLLALYNLI